MIEHLVERWWFIALLGILVILCAPPISLALRRIRLPEAIRGASIYKNYAVVRLAADRPGLTIYVGLRFIKADKPIPSGYEWHAILHVERIEKGKIEYQIDFEEIRRMRNERLKNL